MNRVVFITAEDSLFGFSLAGVTQYAASLPDAGVTLARAMEEPETGLIIMDERLALSLEEEKMNELRSAWPGILLVLPSPGKPEPGAEDYAVRLIRRAIGYHLRVSA